MIARFVSCRYVAMLVAGLLSMSASAAPPERYIDVSSSEQLILGKDDLPCCEAYEDEPTRRLLSEAFADDVVLRVLFWAAFEPEAAIGMRYRGGNYELFRASPKYPMWWYTRPDMIPKLQSDHPDLPDDILRMPVSRCVAPIDKITGQALIALWRHMLSDVIDAQYFPGTDGESYTFSMRGGPATGFALSPRRFTKVTRLVNVVNLMGEYCRAPSPHVFTMLSGAIAAVDRP